MRKTALFAAVLLLVTAGAAPAAHLQKLTAGNWTGTATPPDGMTMDIIWTVAYEEDTTKITLQVPEAGMAIEAQDVELDDDMLTFALDIETAQLACAFERQDDGSFAGECMDAGGGAGYVTMVPPSGN